MQIDNDEAVLQAFAAHIEPVKAEMLGLISVVRERADKYGQEPLDGSPGGAERAVDDGLLAHFPSPPILDARHLGSLQLHAAEEHFSAMCRLVAMDETVVFADKVLIRAGIEAAARSVWLFDPRIDGRTRAARGLTERLYGFHHTRQFSSGDELAKRDAKQGEIIRRAAAAGLQTGEPRKQPRWVGAQRPGATRVMELMLDAPVSGFQSLGRASQAYFSLFVHSTTMGLLTMADSSKATARGQFDMNAPLMSSSGDVAAFISLCIVCYVVAAETAMRYYGWIDDDWERQVQNARKVSARYL